MSLTLSAMDNGSWVVFELPGFTTAEVGAEQSSLDALRDASSTSYYNGEDALWVKVVVVDAPGGGRGGRGRGGFGGGANSVQVSR